MSLNEKKPKSGKSISKRSKKSMAKKDKERLKKAKDRDVYEVRRDKRIQQLHDLGLTKREITAHLKAEGYTKFIKKSVVNRVVTAYDGKQKPGKKSKLKTYEYKDLPVKQQIAIENNFKGWKEMPEEEELLEKVKTPKTIKLIKGLYRMYDADHKAELKADKKRPRYYKIDEEQYKWATEHREPIDLTWREEWYKTYQNAGKKLPWGSPTPWSQYGIPSGKYQLIESGTYHNKRFISLGLLNKKNEVVNITSYRIPISMDKKVWKEFDKLPYRYILDLKKPIYFKVKTEIIDYETARLKARRKHKKLGKFGSFDPKSPKTTRYQRYIKVKYLGSKK